MMEALMMAFGAAILMFSAYALAIIIVLWIGDKLDSPVLERWFWAGVHTLRQWGRHAWTRLRDRNGHGSALGKDVAARTDNRDE